MLKPLLWIIAVSQLVLAALTLFLPLTFFGWMGLTVPAADNGYMIGMLGARFLAYGLGMVMLARADSPSRFWLGNMLLIQLVDLALALVYLSSGTVSLSVAGMPMVNAALFSAGLFWCLTRPDAARAT
jgi:hypothetical protein